MDLENVKLKPKIIQTSYSQQGFVKCPKVFSSSELLPIKRVVHEFHQAWLKDNQTFYQAKAINSSGLTSDQYLNDKQRLVLFKLICSDTLMNLVRQALPTQIFMGTQLFFDPHNVNQANYWHRDPQYHLSVEEQKLALTGPEVLHVRIPLTADPGVELIPRSQINWDNEEELQVRLEQNGHKNNEPLSRGEEVPLQMGDVLLFSANMIHRGLYGNNRFALDILYCERAPQLTEFIQLKHQPSTEMLTDLDKNLFL